MERRGGTSTTSMGKNGGGGEKKVIKMYTNIPTVHTSVLTNPTCNPIHICTEHTVQEYSTKGVQILA